MTPFATGIWTLEQRLRVGGIEMGARTVVVMLDGGGLWVHTPGPDIEAAREAIAALGPVVALVAPNLLHYRFLGAARRVFPDARVFLASGLLAKRPELAPGEELGAEAPDLWRGQLEQLAVGGVPKLGEVVFWHRPSRTLILGDLAFNIRRASAFARLFWRLDGAWDRFGGTRLLRSWVKDRAAFLASLRAILAWDFDRVTLGHGDLITAGGKDAFRAGFARELAWARDAPVPAR